MKSLLNLAASYEDWASKYEAAAEAILARIDSLDAAIRDHELERADQMTAEATTLRTQAAEIRKARFDELHGLTTVSGR